MTEKPVGQPIRVEKENKGIENLKKLKAWIKNNPKKSYGIIATVLVLILSLLVWSVIQNNIKKAEIQAKIEQEKAKIKEEESRDYFIKVEDVNTDCVATFNSLTDSLGCNKIKISGEFSKYETVELRESFSSDNSLDANGGKFEKNKESSFGLYQFYPRDNYNPQDTNFFEEKVTFEIFNKVLNKVVKSKTITIRYNLTDEDKNLFVNKFNEYKNKKQAEAEELQRKEAEYKAIREKKEAEENAKKEQEDKNRTESSTNSSAQAPAQPNSANSEYEKITKGMSEAETDQILVGYKKNLTSESEILGSKYKYVSYSKGDIFRGEKLKTISVTFENGVVESKSSSEF